MSVRKLFLVLFLVLGSRAPLPCQPPGALQTWRREASGFEADPGCGDAPVAVGSLQKPFVAKAWALAHPGQPSPRLLCEAGSGCWNHAGHGELGLSQALAVSCNSYFKALAAATPGGTLAGTLTGEGFSLRQELTPELAIGLASDRGPMTIRPSRILEAYLRLARAPWPAGEAIRQEVLAGLKEAALTGTAASLGQRGYWAKTGTVPIPGDTLHTNGLVLALDASGWGILACLSPGTGSEAAAALAGPLGRLRPWAAASKAHGSLHPRPSRSRGAPRAPASPETQEGLVSIRLLELLRPEHLFLRNAGATPLRLQDGYLGAGSRMELKPGDRVGPGLLELEAPEQGLLRRLEGSLVCGPGLHLSARVTPREYASGILEGELPRESPLRIALGAAVLRFLQQPPRHRDADVCDSTHCAWFVGRGPRLHWADPGRAQSMAPGPERGRWGFSDEEWAAVQEAARQPGPSLWTSHCGGRSLAPHALWGSGERQAAECPRHGPGQTRPWLREWSAAQLAVAFGPGVERIEVVREDGVWGLRVRSPKGLCSYSYDAAHRQLAKSMGWGALPSPADTVEPVPGGWRARGVGLGHRVGLCLGD